MTAGDQDPDAVQRFAGACAFFVRLIFVLGDRDERRDQATELARHFYRATARGRRVLKRLRRLVAEVAGEIAGDHPNGGPGQ